MWHIFWKVHLVDRLLEHVLIWLKQMISCWVQAVTRGNIWQEVVKTNEIMKLFSENLTMRALSGAGMVFGVF